MATSFMMMCGRLGGVSGSSIIGLLLINHCSLIFYSFGGVLISMSHSMCQVKIDFKQYFNFIFFIFFRLRVGFHNRQNKTTVNRIFLRMCTDNIF